jgi:hypothetical protein
MRWADNVALKEGNEKYTRKSSGEETTWKYNSEMDLTDLECERVD